VLLLEKNFNGFTMEALGGKLDIKAEKNEI